MFTTPKLMVAVDIVPWLAPNGIGLPLLRSISSSCSNVTVVAGWILWACPATNPKVGLCCLI